MFGERKKAEGYVVETFEQDGKPKHRSVYIGKLMAYDSPRLALRIRIFLCAVGAYLVACFLACGFSAFHNNVLYVLIPFVLQVITIALYLMSVVNLMVYGVVVKLYDYGKSINRIRPVCIVHAVLAGIAAVGDAFYVAFDPSFSSAVHEATFIAFSALGAVAAILGALVVPEFKLHEVQNPEKERIDAERERQKEIDALIEFERKQKIREQSRRANEKRNKNKKHRK